MDVRVDGKVALVTGASRGIGRAIAARLCESGASVMLVACKEEGLREAAESLAGAGGEVTWRAANVGDPDAPLACVAAAVERYGSLDILVNNAATNPYFGPLVDLDRARADKTLQVNLSAVLTWTQAAWHASMAQGGGAVVNVSSVGGYRVERGIGWYNVTKASVIHLTRQLAYELGPGVRVNALAPGLVRTEFARALWEPAGDAVAKRLPLRRLGEPDDIATAALFAASDAASWMTGHVLVIDGGALSVPSGGV